MSEGRNRTVADNAIVIYERAMSRYLGHRRPFEAGEISGRIRGDRVLQGLARQVAESRNTVRHVAGRDASHAQASITLNNVEKALQRINNRQGVMEVQRLRHQLSVGRSNPGNSGNRRYGTPRRRTSNRASGWRPPRRPIDWTIAAVIFVAVLIIVSLILNQIGIDASMSGTIATVLAVVVTATYLVKSR